MLTQTIIWPTTPAGLYLQLLIPLDGASVQVVTPASYKSATFALCEYNVPGGDPEPCPYQGALNYDQGDFDTQIGPSNATGAFNGDIEPSVQFRMVLPSGKHVNPDDYLLVGPGKTIYFNAIPVNPPGPGPFGALLRFSAN